MNSNIPIVNVGPVIGKVDENSARILIEIDQEIEITLKLKEVSSGEIKEKQAFSLKEICLKNHPKIFKFEGLQANTKYEVIITNQVNFLNPELNSLKSFFRTTSKIGDVPQNFNLVFLSCNSSRYHKSLENPETSLWNTLCKKVKKEEVNYVIHMGDQIYADDGHWHGNEDNCFSKASKIWNEAFNSIYSNKQSDITEEADLNFDFYSKEKDEKFNKEKKRLSEEVIELISREYKSNWNIKSIAETLRNVPNLTILDDHEIFDDFGFEAKTYSDKESFENFFADKARFCYYKYQKQLNEDVDFDNYPKAEKEHHYHLINNVGIFIQDFRGCFSWGKESTDAENYKGKLAGFLGKAQTDDILKCFGNDGLFEKTKFSFFVSANPLVFFSQFITNLAKEKVNDCYEQWAFAAPEEQTELLDIFVDFKKRTGTELMLLSGDVHIGCFTSIYKNDEQVLQQMITSPICQKPPTDLEFQVMSTLRFVQTGLSNGYSFQHSQGTNKCNFGLIQLSEKEGKFSAKSTHVTHVEESYVRVTEENDEFFLKTQKRKCCYDCLIL